MSLPFKSLPEFIEARDGNKIALYDFCGLIDEFDFNKLISVLAKNFFLRIIAVKKWFKEVEKLCNIKIKLKISFKSHKPYMRESGEVGLSFKDLLKPSYLLLAIAHETAHFILTCDGDYPLLKLIDGEYPSDAKDCDLRSPIEYCANDITLTILEKCALVAKKDKHKKKILRFIDNLKKQSAIER